MADYVFQLKEYTIENTTEKKKVYVFYFYYLEIFLVNKYFRSTYAYWITLDIKSACTLESTNCHHPYQLPPPVPTATARTNCHHPQYENIFFYHFRAFKLAPKEDTRKVAVFAGEKVDIIKWMDVIKSVQSGVNVSQENGKYCFLFKGKCTHF